MTSSLFQTLKITATVIDRFQCRIVRLVQWLVLIMTLCVCVVIVSRFFKLNSVALQESITYMHASVFMLSIAYTAFSDGHVRVDIAYRRFTPLNQAWVNLIGSSVFLLPFAIFLVIVTWPSALQSWAIRESSTNPGGLPLVFLLKSLPPISGALLLLHAISDICKQLCFVSLKNAPQ